MRTVIANPFRGGDASRRSSSIRTAISVEVGRLLALCPAHARTPLVDLPDLAARIGIARLQVKDERGRMGLGSFKALGAAYAIAREARESVRDGDWGRALAGRTYVAASAGNHGLSVAAGARLFGATAVIYLAETVPEAFAERLRGKGAKVVRAGATYEESMEAARGGRRCSAADAALGQFMARLRGAALAGHGGLSAARGGGRRTDRDAADAHHPAGRRRRTGGRGRGPCPRGLGRRPDHRRGRTGGRARADREHPGGRGW